MSSSILSNNNCGPVTGLLSNQTFLLHAQTPQKTISSPPPLWRTFYAPPPSPQFQPTTLSIIDDNNSRDSLNNNNNIINNNNNNNNNSNIIKVSKNSSIENYLNHRMTLQKLSSLSGEQTTQVASTQKSIMSVSKLVSPTPKAQHPHHQHQHVPLHHQAQQHQQQQHHHHHQQQHHYVSDIQTGPINLVTNSQTDAGRSRPSSNSSVDIESDDIPEPTRQQQHQQHQQKNLNNVGAIVAAPISAAYQLNYGHLYANKSGYHNAAAVAAADTLRLHPSYSYAAMAAAAAAAAASATAQNNNIFPINPLTTSVLSHHQNIALAPPSPLSSNVSPSAIEQQQQILQHQQQQHEHQDQKSRLSNSSDQMFSPPLPANVTTALSNGTYLNCKSSPASDSADSSSENYFKVPNTSGKEGSLKHRILTRPASLTEKEEKSSKNPVISTHNSTANFKKGSYIELANGVLRRVEDMRTEDFIQCADRSLHLQLAESTVVKIDAIKPQMVVITFSYDRNRSKADIEVSLDHPFFVYGQGWASCDPEMSHKAFGLKCQRLQVGDICISLTQRTTTVVTVKNEVCNKEQLLAENLRYIKTELPPSSENLTLAMPIKNELHTVMPPPPAATVHGLPTRPQMHYIPCAMPPASTLPHHQMPYSDFAELVAAAAAYNNSAHLHHMQATMPPPPSPDAINGFYQQTQQLYLQGKVTAADLRLQPPPTTHPTSNVAHNYCPTRNALLPPPSRSQQQHQHLSPLHDHPQDEPFDASISSRKRRWSAPEGECDETGEQRDHCQNSKLYKTVTAPVTT